MEKEEIESFIKNFKFNKKQMFIDFMTYIYDQGYAEILLKLFNEYLEKQNGKRS